MRVVTSLEFGGARILQEFWMTVLKVLSRNKKKATDEQGRQSRATNNKRSHLLMKKRSLQSVRLKFYICPSYQLFVF